MAWFAPILGRNILVRKMIWSESRRILKKTRLRRYKKNYSNHEWIGTVLCYINQFKRININNVKMEFRK